MPDPESIPHTDDPVRLLGSCLRYLRRARNRARAAKAPRATDAIRKAISSAEGAHRHAVLAAANKEPPKK